MGKLIAIIVAAVLVCGGAVAAGVAVANSPKNVASRTLSGFVEDLMERDELAPLDKILNGGSVEFSAEGEGLGNMLDIDKTFGVSGKLYLAENAAMLDDLVINYGATRLTGSIYGSEDRFYIENNEILGGVWGFEKGDLYDDWSRSIFAPNSGEIFAMDKATFDMVGEFMKALDEDTDKELMADLEDVSSRYIKKAWKLLGKYAEFDSVTEEVRINRVRDTARVITITLDAKAVGSIVEGMYEYLADDEKVTELIEKYGDRLETILKESYEIADAADAYVEFIDGLSDEVDMLVDSIEEEMDGDLVVTMVTPKMSAELLMLSVEYDKADILTLEIGHEGIVKTDCISLKLMDGVEFVYRIDADTKDEFKAEVEMNGKAVITLDIDRKDENYRLELKDLCCIEGDLVSKRGKHTITIDRVQSLAIGVIFDYKDLGITVKLQEKDKMPTPAEEITPILSVNEETFEKWGERLADFAFPLFDDNLFYIMGE